MKDIKQEVLNAIDILIDKKIDRLKFDKTVKGTIIKVLDNNYYEVNISGVVYKLKYTKEILKIHSSVWVLIPNNDYKSMFILCKAEVGN